MNEAYAFKFTSITKLVSLLILKLQFKMALIIWYHLHVESKKNDTNELIYQTKIYIYRKWTMVTKVESMGKG